MDISPSHSDGSLVSMDESMSTFDTVRSPEVEYINDHESAMVDSIEKKLYCRKYEEICAPQVEKFYYITNNTYFKEEVYGLDSQNPQWLNFAVTLKLTYYAESNHVLWHGHSQDGHEILVVMERAELYCSVCCDHVYDPDFDKVVICKHMKGFSRSENGAEESEMRLSKRRRLSFGMDLDSKNMKRLFIRKSKSCFPLGLRAVFSGDRSPYSPTQFVYRAFYGLLRSEVTCASCGFTSTTHDPCMDISLDLSACNSSRKDLASKSSKPIESLVGCLDLFTRPEKLGSHQKLYCENCHEKQDALKQMSIKKHPLVLYFHIKRFEHSPTRKMSRKIDCHVQFSFSLDMKPYLSSSIASRRGKLGHDASRQQGGGGPWGKMVLSRDGGMGWGPKGTTMH
ncbi:hypothetical protein MTR67_035595 [Solanum verrucosum]|uniref:USP domain-containing protein n=1 Tax=Solanum verrucosum TaxID=315347 RepID=A0AAF0UAI3_SOLVR|nr:hypothetical protein MTR67_035595 [Solanum verrucosum]